MIRTFATLAGIALFASVLVWYAMAQGGIECTVCMASGVRQHCATVSAGSAEEARTRAQQVACGVVTDGMADELACQRAAPSRVVCEP